MKHTPAERAAHNPGRLSAEMPALLVPGGSCSSLCRPVDYWDADAMLTRQWFYCTDVFWTAAKQEWAGLTDLDRREIEQDGVSALVRKLESLCGFSEDEALARINAVNLSVNQRTDGFNSPRYR